MENERTVAKDNHLLSPGAPSILSVISAASLTTCWLLRSCTGLRSSSTSFPLKPVPLTASHPAGLSHLCFFYNFVECSGNLSQLWRTAGARLLRSTSTHGWRRTSRAGRCPGGRMVSEETPAQAGVAVAPAAMWLMAVVFLAQVSARPAALQRENLLWW